MVNGVYKVGDPQAYLTLEETINSISSLLSPSFFLNQYLSVPSRGHREQEHIILLCGWLHVIVVMLYSI